MAIVPDRVKQQVRERFAERLSGPVQLDLYTRPGTGRLILPSGMGCATCNEARELAESIEEAAPDLVRLRVIDVTEQETDVTDVPTLTLGFPGEPHRIHWVGLPAGYEFATVIDAIERVSTGDHGLSSQTMEALGNVMEPVHITVFATPG